MTAILGYLLAGIIAIISGVVALWKYKAFAVQEPEPIEPLEVPTSPKTPPTSPVLPEVKEVPMPTKTNREKLYDTAYACRGKDMSPLDRAPDNLACMESLDGVYFTAFGEHLLKQEDRLSTARGYASMKVDPRLELIQNADALPGDIVISPTGTSTKGALHGHTGIRGKTAYMSNDSSSGLWMANYNLPNWKLVFQDTLGFPIYHFRVKG